jgi:hypothetical protein
LDLARAVNQDIDISVYPATFEMTPLYFMRNLFYLGIIGIILFEFLNVYLIMPMPGSQQMDSLEAAYFLHTNRWYFRVLFLVFTLAGTPSAFRKSRWIPFLLIMIAVSVSYVFNFRLNAESMFREPLNLTFANRSENTLNDSSLVLAVSSGVTAKAYPIRFIGYHHQVRDSIDGKPILVTYCTVCRTGRVYEPIINGKTEQFRLVGMDHFNAMFEDVTTRSWWRQVSGEAVVGPLKGTQLPEIESQQLTLGKFFFLYPFGQVMQADDASVINYDSLARYEKGLSISHLTRRDSLSWNDKSWVLGVMIGNSCKAYDWNHLLKVGVINDVVDSVPVAIVLSADGQSFSAFERPAMNQILFVRNDTLLVGNLQFDFNGNGISDSTHRLKRISVYQEYWHSWRTFHPDTKR